MVAIRFRPWLTEEFMSAFVEIEGTIEDVNGVRVFLSKVFEPVKDMDTPYKDSLCKIHCPALLDRDFDVYGVNGDQAKELALRYVRSRLAGAIVRDRGGRIVNL
jgi:hypothetical protein